MHQVTHLLHEASLPSMTLHLHQNAAQSEKKKIILKKNNDQASLSDDPSALYKEMTGLNLNWDKNYPH